MNCQLIFLLYHQNGSLKYFYLYLEVNYNKDPLIYMGKIKYSSNTGPVERKILLLLSALFIVFLACQPSESFARGNGGENNENRLTIYVIPSAAPLDWQSPSTLYKSFFKGYVAKMLRSEKYLIGHLFIKLTSPLLEKPLLTGMRSASKREKKNLVMREKVGLAILGIGMKGRLEDPDELVKKIGYYSRKKEIASITYLINDESVKRILEFYRIFTSKFNDKYSPADFYGGAFWPLYEYEGAGCTAFGMSMLDLAKITGNETNLWKVDVNIPMKLIGGELNHNLKVKTQQIKKTHEWASGTGVDTVDYVSFSIYDPSLIFNWINRQRELPDSSRIGGYLPMSELSVPGLISDRTSVGVSENGPVIGTRNQNNFFIDHYLKKLGITKTGTVNGTSSNSQ